MSLLERVLHPAEVQLKTEKEAHTQSIIAESARAHLTDEGIELIQAYVVRRVETIDIESRTVLNRRTSVTIDVDRPQEHLKNYAIDVLPVAVLPKGLIYDFDISGSSGTLALAGRDLDSILARDILVALAAKLDPDLRRIPRRCSTGFSSTVIAFRRNSAQAPLTWVLDFPMSPLAGGQLHASTTCGVSGLSA
jgi:hypothetical protein